MYDDYAWKKDAIKLSFNGISSVREQKGGLNERNTNKKENNHSAWAKEIGRKQSLVDEVEVYRTFGGCLPIACARSSYSF